MKNLVVIVVIVGIISTFSKVSHCYRYRSSLQIGPIIIGGGGHSRSPPLSPPPPHSTPPSPTSSKLKVGFYKGLCPNKSVDIEAIISVKVEEAFDKKPSILPALLRMQFHDCFVHVSTYSSKLHVIIFIAFISLLNPLDSPLIFNSIYKTKKYVTSINMCVLVNYYH